VRNFRLGTVAAVAAGLLVPAIAQAADTQSSLYDCQPRDQKAANPPPRPDLSPKMDAVVAEAIASDDFKQVCPAGEVPEPTKTNESPMADPPSPARSETELTQDNAGVQKAQGASASRVKFGPRHGRHRGRFGASISRQPNGGFWYSWAGGWQGVAGSKGVNGLFVQQTNEQPYIPTWENNASAHSLGQLWGINEGGGGCDSTVETGWSESSGQFKDFNPHLFIFAFDCGVNRGYACTTCGNWVQSSTVAFPNMTVTHNDVFHVYGAEMAGNNWWFYYDGQWVGYIPHAVWAIRFPYVLNELEAGGEVATPEKWTCADMGYGGLFGTHPWAAMFSSVWYVYNNSTQGETANMLYQHRLDSDTGAYTSGNWAYNYQFRYGGPGWC
jgi:hypothetical protein